MRQIILLCLGLFLFLFPNQVRGEAQNGCYGAVGAETKKINGFIISIHRYPNQKKFLDECAARVVGSNGKTVFSAHDHGIEIVPISGQDLNGDGEPEAVIEGYSGGLHCCWTYWIVSLGTRPRRLATIYNERAVKFTKERDGRVLIETLDGRFDYFDDLCHACTVFPSVYLRLHDDHLEDVSSEFWPDYQKEIDKASIPLTPRVISRFRMGKAKDMVNFEGMKPVVLSVVLAYLYGGKPEQAWKALDEMWPPQDKERIKKLILKTRGTGFATRSVD
jgi:hypothetical protein